MLALPAEANPEARGTEAGRAGRPRRKNKDDRAASNPRSIIRRFSPIFTVVHGANDFTEIPKILSMFEIILSLFQSFVGSRSR